MLIIENIGTLCHDRSHWCAHFQ